MSGGYKVNIEALGKLIHTLEDGADQVREANKTLAATGQLNMLGNDALKNQAHKFEETWEYGLGKLDEAAKGVIERLQAAKQNYQELEEHYGEEIGRLIPADGGPPTIPGGGIMGGFQPGGNGSSPASGTPGGGSTGGIQDVLGGHR